MDNWKQRRPIEDDDSLLASVAGVPLSRSARIGISLIWAGFWCARFLLTDALRYIGSGQLRPALLELLGENAFDQGFTICMAWLTVEVAAIIWNYIRTGVIMLFAKSSKPFLHMLVDNLPDDKLQIVVARGIQRLQARQQAEAERNGSDDNGAG